MARLAANVICLVADRRMAVTICGLEVRDAARVETPSSWPYRQTADPQARLHPRCATIQGSRDRLDRTIAIRNGAASRRQRDASR